MQRLVIKMECRISWTVNPPLHFLRACDLIHNDHKCDRGKVEKDFSLCLSLKAGSSECDLDTDVTSSVFVWVGRHNDLDICTWTWWPINVGNRCASQTHQEQRKKIGMKPHVLHVSQTFQNKHTSTKLSKNHIPWIVQFQKSVLILFQTPLIFSSMSIEGQECGL
jgi:hypothetical protein